MSLEQGISTKLGKSEMHDIQEEEKEKLEKLCTKL
jgi:hypothetical protein